MCFTCLQIELWQLSKIIRKQRRTEDWVHKYIISNKIIIHNMIAVNSESLLSVNNNNIVSGALQLPSS